MGILPKGLPPYAAAVLAFATAPALAAPPVLTLPATAEQTASQTQALTSLDLPTGPFRDGALPTRKVEGALDQTAWRIGAKDMGTLDLLAPLRKQLQDQGFAVLYECQSETCGGYDFRYATAVLPEPDMHVDLGDFRYVVAEKPGPQGPDYVALMVSRSAHDGFVQLTTIGPETEPGVAAGLGLTTSTKSAAQTALAPALPASAAAKPELAMITGKLAQGQAVVLDDLVFPSGSSQLAQGDYSSLVALADWLRADPARQALLVGHTDGSGTQEANLRLSKTRAESVRQRLIDSLSVDPAQVTADGAGALAPRASNATEEGRRQNRRVEVIATPTLATSQ